MIITDAMAGAWQARSKASPPRHCNFMSHIIGRAKPPICCHKIIRRLGFRRSWVWRTGAASIAIARSVLERELGLQCERLSVQLCIRIDEVVERIAPLRWVEADVSSDRKLQAIVIMRPEEIILLIGVLPSFGSIHRDPAVGLDIELCPAVISRYSPIMLIGRQRKTNFEARRNSGRPHHADKQRMEI